VTGNPHAAFHRRSNVAASTVSLSDNPCNACNVIKAITSAGHTGPAPNRRKQIREHLIGEQLPPMRGQEPKHAARLEKMTRYRLSIK
jgi:hypothetical protein